MLYREYGKTGKMISLLGFGGLRFKEEDLMSEEGLERCAETVRYAIEQGVNYFDCAHSYARGKNEQIYGMAFNNVKVPIYVAAKSGISADKTADDVRKRLETSLMTMGISKVTFYTMWTIMNLEHYEEVMKPGGPYEGAMRAKEEGLIDHITASLHCTPEEILKIIEDKAFDGLTVSFNAVNYEKMFPAIKKAYENGVGIVTMNPLAGGMIAKNTTFFQKLKTDEDKSVIEGALRFNGSFPQISVVLSGMENKKQVEENTAALSDEGKLKFTRISQYEKEIHDSDIKLCTGCGYCKPCPAGIQIPKYMQSYNYKLFAKEDVQNEKEVANLVFRQLRVDFNEIPENRDNPCVKCKRCEKACTQHINIISKIDEMYQMADKYNYNVSSFKERLKKIFFMCHGKKIGIYPASNYAGEIFALYNKYFGEIDFEVFSFNSDEKMWGTWFLGKQVLSPEKIEDMELDAVLIMNYKYQDEIYRELKKMKIRQMEIVKFHDTMDLLWFF